MNQNDRGIVRKIIDTNRALVGVVSLGDCGSCGAKKSCGIFAAKGERTIEARFEESQNITEGDTVVIQIKTQTRILASILLFLVPLLGMIGGYFAGFYIFQKEGAGIIFSLAALGITFALVAYAAKKLPFLQKAACYITKA